MERAGDEKPATVGAEAQLVDGVDVLVEEVVAGRRRGRDGRDGALGARARRLRLRRRRGRLDGGRAVVRRRARHAHAAGAGGRRGGEARRARDGRRRGARAALDARVGLLPRAERILRVRPSAAVARGAGAERQLVLGFGAAEGQVVFVLARALEHAARANLVEQLEVAGRRVPELERAVRVPSGPRPRQCTVRYCAVLCSASRLRLRSDYMLYAMDTIAIQDVSD